MDGATELLSILPRRSPAVEYSPTPHLVLAHGLESGLSHVEQAAQQAALPGSSLQLAVTVPCRQAPAAAHYIHAPFSHLPLTDRQGFSDGDHFY